MNRRPPATLRELIEARAAEQPTAVYASFPETGRTLTFAQLLASVRRLSALLANEDAAPGARVAFLLPNGLQAVTLFLGLQAAGVIAVPLSLLARSGQLAFVLDHAGVELVFAGPQQIPLLREAGQSMAQAPRLIQVDPDAPAAVDTAADTIPPWCWPAPDAEDDSLLMYTSGTTGQPKGVRLSHRNLLAGARFVSEAHVLTASDRVLAVLPLYHINAQVVTLLAPLWHGGSLAMPRRFSVGAFWELAATQHCTWLNVVPTMIAYLLAHDAAPPTSVRQRLRFCRSASAPLAPELHLAFETRFGIGIIETMGLTETAAPCLTNPPDPQRRRLGSPGQPFGNLARIASPDTGEPLPDGMIGEIQILGPNVTRGYHRAPEETARAFTADGWLRTGDLGYRDGEGYYFVTGRLKEIIIKGGENIAPREIDEALLRHPAVLEAAAVGVPDPHYGQEIEAGVVLRGEAACSEAELRAFCLRELGPFKTPRAIRFLPELPKGPSGKVQRLKLLETNRDRSSAA